MRKPKIPESPSNACSLERRNWGYVFNLLVQTVRNQQNQLQSLANQQKFLEDRLLMQHERWTSGIQLYKDQISQVKSFLMFEKKKQLLQAAKAELEVGSKHREASILKWALDSTKDELEDFKAWSEYLSHKSPNGEDQGTVSDTDKQDQGTVSNTAKRKKRNKDSGKKSICNTVEKDKCSDKNNEELRRLKGECEKLASEKTSEILVLLAEKKFVWNQYRIMENDYTDKLSAKQDEVEKANEKIKILLSGMEQLQSENNKKDSRISELESKVADNMAETKRLNKEILGISVELESLRKFRNSQVTPVLNPCTAGGSTLGIIKSNRSRRKNVTSDRGKEICTPDAHSPAKSLEKEVKSLKRKEAPVIPTSETPKLFSSSFKVPKLKPSLRTR